MSNELIKYSFTGGELSPSLYGRSDLEQYDLGTALSKNWIVDYRGGISTRAGFEFCEFTLADDKATKFFEFRFSPDLSNIYLLIFGDNYVRFIQDGSYVLEDAKAITNVAVNIVTSAGHGYAVGDWVKISSVNGVDNINGRTFIISAVTTDTFAITTAPGSGYWAAQTAYVSGGLVSRVYTIASDYSAEDLENLKIYQRRDVLRLTCNNHPIRNLIRNDATNWTFSLEDVGASPTTVSGLNAVGSGAGSAGIVYSVTALLSDGTETPFSAPKILDSIVNYTTTAGYVNFEWAYYPGAKAYNVYRSQVFSDGSVATVGANLGFIGRTVGTTFQDNNIVPDYTKAPPNVNAPFTGGAIETIELGLLGSGYSRDATFVTATGSGTGFLGQGVVNSSGQVVDVLIITPGRGYVNPVLSFSGGGSGATATAAASPITGIYPAVSSIFQQRQIYAATAAKPLTLWASRPGKYSNFDYSEITIDSDSYEFEVDSSEIAPIRHLLAMRGGLLIMSQSGIWQLTGGSGGVVTPTNALADPQNFNGVSPIPPLKVGPDLLYIEGKGFTVRLLSYNEYAKVWSGEDKSILSNHLFSGGKSIVSWTFTENPYKVVNAVRSDGALLHFTIVKEEKVFAWTWSATRGKFLDCLTIKEGNADRLYVMTQRFIDNRWTKFIERQELREFKCVEEAFCVDCGLSLPQNNPAYTLTLESLTDTTATFTVDGLLFDSTSVGRIIRAAGGKFLITDIPIHTRAITQIIRPFTEIVSESKDINIFPQAPGTWSFDEPVNEITGLWHLEGETVSVLGDGNVLPEQVVVDGTITLSVKVTRAHIGLPFTAVIKTLPPVVTDAVIEARRKRIVGVATRVTDTVGLKAGTSLDSLYEPKERNLQLYGEPVDFVDGFRAQLLEPEWAEDSPIYFVQDKPLPATLLGIVFDIEVGDDPD